MSASTEAVDGLHAHRRSRGATHLVIGPPEHGVVRFGLRLGELMGEATVHLEHLAHTTAGCLRSLAASASVHLQYTDALYAGHTTTAASAFLELRHRIQAPVSVTLHDLPDPSDEPGRYQRRAESYRRVVAAADAVAVSSRHELDLLAVLLGPSDHPRPRAVIPLPVEPPSIIAAAQRPRPVPEVAVFGFVHPGKGHGDAIAAMEHLPAGIRFTALGRTADGHEELAAQLQAQAAASGRAMALSGFVPDTDVLTRLRQVAVPLVPARAISASGSINTWISAGRRPLVAEGPYTREFAAHYPGAIHLYRPGHLAQQLARALARPELTWLSQPPPRALSASAVIAGYRCLMRVVREQARVA